ncbi:MAG: DNA polymerase III subunit delta [Proteobacteria bacterium]|nr:DNA polymerase III subunit delta [Pseudomonadota bacterium]
MKLPRDAHVETLVDRQRLRAVLLYGPDGGLAHERATALVRHVAGSADDPFRVVELTVAALKDDPARLADEVAAQALTGGRRAVWLRDAGDALASGPLADLLDDAVPDRGGDTVVVLEAGDLPARSSLRKLVEGATRAVAVGCYHDEARDVATVIRDAMTKHGLSVAPDALRYLSEHLGGDRLVTRAEIDKLALYMQHGGDDTTGGRTVALEDALATVGDSAAIALDDVISATADGRPADLERALGRALLDGESPVRVVRVCLQHFQRLHLARARMDAGAPAVDAIGSLRPPPFRRDAERMARQLQRWSPRRLAAALDRLLQAEVECKSTALPDQTMCAQALLDLARAAEQTRR